MSGESVTVSYLSGIMMNLRLCVRAWVEEERYLSCPGLERVRCRSFAHPWNLMHWRRCRLTRSWNLLPVFSVRAMVRLLVPYRWWIRKPNLMFRCAPLRPKHSKNPSVSKIMTRYGVWCCTLNVASPKKNSIFWIVSADWGAFRYGCALIGSCKFICIFELFQTDNESDNCRSGCWKALCRTGYASMYFAKCGLGHIVQTSKRVHVWNSTTVVLLSSVLCSRAFVVHWNLYRNSCKHRSLEIRTEPVIRHKHEPQSGSFNISLA